MAFTKSPENSTYRTVDLEFTENSWLRSSTFAEHRDPELINMFFERNTNENQTRSMVLVKRPGFYDSVINLNKSSSSSLVNGYFQDSSSNYIYWSTENKVFSYNIVTTTLTQIATITGTETSYINSVGFCAFLTSVGTRYICFNNGAELWYHVVGSGTSTQVVDVDYPGTTYPSIVFLDGYLFVIKRDTGDIYNSDLDDPSSWTAGNYATAEINPDYAVALAKVKNYLVCFGRDGIEFFYDAANLAGSPLGRNESFYKAVSLTSNVCTIGDSLFFSGNLQNQGNRIYELTGENLQVISNSWVDRILQDAGLNALTSKGLGHMNGFSLTMMGHHFYIFNQPYSGIFLVYDLDIKLWSRWEPFSETNALPVVQAVWNVNSITQQNPLICLSTTTTISTLSNTVYQDYGTNFTCSYTTADYTSETFNWKSCSRVGLYCDYPATGGAETYAQVSWSDDDGNTFSTPRNLNVHSNNPYITQCGRFRSRNWRIEYEDNYPFRMWGLSMDLNIGNI